MKAEDDIKTLLSGAFMFIILVIFGVGFVVHKCQYSTDPEYRARHDKDVAERAAQEQAKKDAPKRIAELEAQMKALREQLPPTPLEHRAPTAPRP